MPAWRRPTATSTKSGRSAENARKAYALREKVSERERLRIETSYYLYATGELEKAAQTFELWQQNYPRDGTPYTNLSFIYMNLGNWEKALEEARGAIRLRPNTASNYPNLAIVYMSLNRLDDAEAVFKQAEERKVANEFLLYSPYEVAFLKGDTAADGADGGGGHGQAGQRRSAAGHASRHRRLVWEVKECKRADPAGDGFSAA